ncbi:hypothetical protein L3Y34_007538 [Caenorhabditis briggsae]|uniref:glucuronosyltransferase n=1 Tax=Caenorhabditis briggsae TaxID=6238 RepID=A0AAE8ZX31_CAEBR|nr:hypothetical protein L3Y34_007538 [Caenorhabditis briggsae]
MFKLFKILFFILCIPHGIFSLRVLFYTTVYGKSHLDFADSLINVLVEKGHTVDLVISRINDMVIGNGGNRAERIYSIDMKNGTGWAKRPHLQDPFKELEFYYGNFREWNQIGHDICEHSVNDDHLLDFIASKKYDIAITSDFDFCALGIISLFNIPARATSNPCPITSLQTIVIGIPNPPSTTIPSALFQPADITTLYGKFWNVINWAYLHFIQIPEIKATQEQIFRKRFGKKFSIDRALSKIDLSFINSNEIMEKPRPLHHRFQLIGGINLRSPKPLNENLESILSKSRNGTILFSFGTQVAGDVYPRYAVKNFVKVFKKFPGYTFLWKYEIKHGEERMFEEAKNVVVMDWLPQTDLLNDARVVGFISHLGLNSFNEVSYAGKPIISIPLFADQPHNTDNGVHRGTTVRLDKTQLTEESIEKALRAILFDSSYRRNAKMLQKMLNEKPETPKERFTKWVEFAAANPGLHKVFKLPGVEMGMLEYFCIDAILYVMALFLIMGYTANTTWMASFVIIAVLSITRLAVTFFHNKAWQYDTSVVFTDILTPLELYVAFPIMLLNFGSYLLILGKIYRQQEEINCCDHMIVLHQNSLDGLITKNYRAIIETRFHE